MAEYNRASRESSLEEARQLSLNPSQETVYHDRGGRRSLIQPPAIASSMQLIPTYNDGKKHPWASRLRPKQQPSNAAQSRHIQSQL